MHFAKWQSWTHEAACHRIPFTRRSGKGKTIGTDGVRRLPGLVVGGGTGLKGDTELSFGVTACSALLVGAQVHAFAGRHRTESSTS